MSEGVNTLRSGFSYTGLFVPTNFIGTLKEDYSTISASGLNFQDEKVKAAAKRILLAFGMLMAACMLVNIACNYVVLAIKMAITTVIYLIFRDLFERSRGDKGTIATLQENANGVLEKRGDVWNAINAGVAAARASG